MFNPLSDAELEQALKLQEESRDFGDRDDYIDRLLDTITELKRVEVPSVTPS